MNLQQQNALDKKWYEAHLRLQQLGSELCSCGHDLTTHKLFEPCQDYTVDPINPTTATPCPCKRFDLQEAAKP